MLLLKVYILINREIIRVVNEICVLYMKIVELICDMVWYQVKFSSVLVVVKGCVQNVGVKICEFRLTTIAFAKYYILG